MQMNTKLHDAITVLRQSVEQAKSALKRSCMCGALPPEAHGQCDACQALDEIEEKEVSTNAQASKAQIQSRPLEERAPLLVQIAGVAGEVTAEAEWAMTNWPPFNSAHEGYAVLLEEVEELWAHVKTNQKKRNLKEMRKEAVQVAAMAMRFAIEVCDEQKGRK
jgi:exopolyphosphatase/pppGpp-phosphohydrolase